MKNLIVVCAGGFSKEVIWLAKETQHYNILGVLDDKVPAGTNVIYDLKVLGNIEHAKNYQSCEFIIANGNPRTRKFIAEKLTKLGINSFATLISPSVKMSDTIKIGKGCIICAGTILTVDITIGEHSIVNINSTVGHDCQIGSFCTIAPLVAISGNVTLEDLTEVGTAASIRQQVKLSKGSMLGMGSVLTKSIPENEIFVGSPARYLKSFE